MIERLSDLVGEFQLGKPMLFNPLIGGSPIENLQGLSTAKICGGSCITPSRGDVAVELKLVARIRDLWNFIDVQTDAHRNR